METKPVEPKLLAAIGAAVTAYVEAEQEIPPTSVPVRPAAGLWASLGRQEQMDRRVMCQLRVFKK